MIDTEGYHIPNREEANAYEEGVIAFRQGVDRQSNPYPRSPRGDLGTPFASWEHGWADASYKAWRADQEGRN